MPVRKIMTCCADDVGLYGYPCKIGKKMDIQKMKWMKVRVRFAYESFMGGDDRQPVLYLVDMEETDKPENDVVYLG